MGSGMTTETSKERRSPKKGRMADGFVMMAMAIVTLALCMGLVAQVGMGFWLAVTVSAAFYMGLLTLHALVRRHDQFDELRAEVDRLTGEVARLNQVGGGGSLIRMPPAANPAGPMGRAASMVAPPPVGAPRQAAVDPLARIAAAMPPPVSAPPLSAPAMSAPPISAPPISAKAQSELGRSSAGEPPAAYQSERHQPEAQQTEPKSLSAQVGDELGHELQPGSMTADPRDPTAHQMQKIVRAPQMSAPRSQAGEGRGPESGTPMEGVPASVSAQVPPAASPTLAAAPEPETRAAPPPLGGIVRTRRAMASEAPRAGERKDMPPPLTSRPEANEAGFDIRRSRAAETARQDELKAMPIDTMAAGMSSAAPPPMPASLGTPTGNSPELTSEPPAEAGWAFRPGDEMRQPGFSPSESDVEMIQGLIKKLADEVNSTDAHKLAQTRSREAMDDDALDRSVGALRQAARNMQEPLTTPRGSRSARPAAQSGPASAHVEPTPAQAGPTTAQPAAASSPSFGEKATAPTSTKPTPAPSATKDTAPPAPSASAMPEFDVEALMRRAQPIATMTSMPPPLPSAPNVLDKRAEPKLAEENKSQAGLASARDAEIAADDIWNAVAGDTPADESHGDDEAGERMTRISEALEAGRVDVFLEPILDLEKQQARHFEVSVRLRDENGDEISPDDQIETERPSGALPLLDSVRLQRTAHVARRLEERNKQGNVFATFSGQSLTADEFLSTFAETYDAQMQLSGQLVLTFSQADARRFRTPQWTMINEMRDLGFGFALRSVTDLDMDFEMFAAAGFKFVKLDAEVFLSGLPASDAVVPAADLCKHLEDLGLEPVVEAIDDVAKREQVYAYGVRLGQGSLFGGARQIKTAVASGAHTAAA
mgnify:CR=1 FL=1